MNNLETTRQKLLQLSHDLGAEHRHLAILGEGNTSARLGPDTFLVKASGSSLGTLTEADLVECYFEPLLALLEAESVSDEAVDTALRACRVHPEAKRPSVEALFHAYLLSLPGVAFVGHTHAIAVNSILCSPRAADYAFHRTTPDEIVCCGPASVLVPYTDPGIWLAQEMQAGTQRFREEYGILPRVILLLSHGIVTFGGSIEAVKASMFMAVKAAHTFLGAASLGGPQFLPAEVIQRILNRTDEHYRQKALNL
jgi:rhamnose utilization protein RhaD (predicted bifunctional aldolase and dehydrogenase)